MVDILVGSVKHVSRIHKDLICVRLRFFDRIFNGRFKEAQEQIATLPENDVDSFELFVRWLYEENFVLKCESAENGNGKAVLRFYAFAAKICEITLADTIMDAISKCNFRTVEEIAALYPHTGPDTYPTGLLFMHYKSHWIGFLNLVQTKAQSMRFHTMAQSSRWLYKSWKMREVLHRN